MKNIGLLATGQLRFFVWLEWDQCCDDWCDWKWLLYKASRLLLEPKSLIISFGCAKLHGLICSRFSTNDNLTESNLLIIEQLATVLWYMKQPFRWHFKLFSGFGSFYCHIASFKCGYRPVNIAWITILECVQSISYLSTMSTDFVKFAKTGNVAVVDETKQIAWKKVQTHLIPMLTKVDKYVSRDIGSKIK